MKYLKYYTDLRHRECHCTAKEKAELLKNEIARFFIDMVPMCKTQMPPYTKNGIGGRSFADSVKGGCYGRAW